MEQHLYTTVPDPLAQTVDSMISALGITRSAMIRWAAYIVLLTDDADIRTLAQDRRPGSQEWLARAPIALTNAIAKRAQELHMTEVELLGVGVIRLSQYVDNLGALTQWLIDHQIPLTGM